jgi:hypothetical protein
LKTAKAVRKKTYTGPARTLRQYVNPKSRTTVDSNRPLRVNVRAPKVHVTTPVPQVSVMAATPTVQVEAPSVTVEAPKPIIIPPPVVQVEVEDEEHPDEASMKGLRKELLKCMKQNQTVELVLAADFGSPSHRYPIGTLVRVDEGIVELKMTSIPDGMKARTMMIPLNRIVAICL